MVLIFHLSPSRIFGRILQLTPRWNLDGLVSVLLSVWLSWTWMGLWLAYMTKSNSNRQKECDSVPLRTKTRRVWTHQCRILRHIAYVPGQPGVFSLYPAHQNVVARQLDQFCFFLPTQQSNTSLQSELRTHCKSCSGYGKTPNSQPIFQILRHRLLIQCPQFLLFDKLFPLIFWIEMNL